MTRKRLGDEIADEEDVIRDIADELVAISERLESLGRRLETLRRRAVDQETALRLRSAHAKRTRPPR